MQTLLFDSATLNTLDRGGAREYLYSFSALLLRETVEKWCFPKTTLDIDILGRPTPHMTTLRRHLDTFLCEHDDGKVFVQWLAGQSCPDFEGTLSDMSQIFEETFRYSLR